MPTSKKKIAAKDEKLDKPADGMGLTSPIDGSQSRRVPNSVRYVKNGKGGRWWKAARENRELHVGWSDIPSDLLSSPDLPRIEALIRASFGPRKGATQDFNALCDLLRDASERVWVTFEDGYLWWCTVKEGATVNPEGQSSARGHFWLACDGPWSNRTIHGKLLSFSDLPGTVTTTAGFQGTVCTPTGGAQILRIIRDEIDPDATAASDARRTYERAVLRLITRLSWKDFEQLIDLILARTGWTRISTLGKTREGIDTEAENLTAGEIAFVQVKSSATQEVFDDYVERFTERRDFYARMIFAVHSPKGSLKLPDELPAVQLWTGEQIAQRVVRLGLGEWVESKIA